MAQEPPNTMRAWQYTNHDSQNRGIEHNLTLNTISIPEPSPNQHLVKILAVGLNPADYKRFEDIFGFVLQFANKNATPGMDFAGQTIIPAAGTGIKPGQIVFGVASASPVSGRGPLSEYAVVDKTLSGVAPDGVEALQVAGLAVAGISAYQSILRYAKVGDRVLINGGSGGTGIFGIQIAKASGLHVTATCSTANIESVRLLGANDVVDYSRVGSLVDALAEKEPFDLVVDNAGYDWGLYYSAHRYTKVNAPYVMVAGGWGMHFLSMFIAKLTPAMFGGGRRPLKTFLPDPKIEDVMQIVEWVREGKVTVKVDSVFDFEKVPDAFRKLKTGRAKGKILVKVSDVSS